MSFSIGVSLTMLARVGHHTWHCLFQLLCMEHVPYSPNPPCPGRGMRNDHDTKVVSGKSPQSGQHTGHLYPLLMPQKGALRNDHDTRLVGGRSGSRVDNTPDTGHHPRGSYGLASRVPFGNEANTNMQKAGRHGPWDLCRHRPRTDIPGKNIGQTQPRASAGEVLEGSRPSYPVSFRHTGQHYQHMMVVYPGFRRGHAELTRLPRH